MIKDKIYSVLSTDAALSVSTNAIRPIVLDQDDELPAITFQLEMGSDTTFDGNSALQNATLEMNVYANSLSQAEAINNEMKSAIVGVAGVESGLSVYNIYRTRQIEDFDSEDGEYRINTQFTINYKEG